MSKVIAIAASDIHLHDWEAHSEDHSRLYSTEHFIHHITAEANEYKVPLLLSGDLVHNPKSISQYTFHSLMSCSLHNKVNKGIFSISGNHDMCEKNTLKHTSPTYIQSLYPWITNVDNIAINTHEFQLLGIPYYNYEADFLSMLKVMVKLIDPNRVSILMVHQNLPGAVEPDGYEVESELPKELYKIFRKFTWVLSGHIHKPQKIFKNTFMLGAIQHQDLGDLGCEMGYWKIYADQPPKFIPSKLPEFKLYEGEKPNNYDMWIERGREEEAIEEQSKDFNVLSSRTRLAKNFCAEKGIDDKSKVKALIKSLNRGN